MRIALTSDQYDNVVFRTLDFDPDASFRPNYSGRGMYGRSCVGIVYDNAEVVGAFMYFLAEELEMDYLDLLLDLGFGAVDSMGLSKISYWSGLTADTGGEEE